MTEIDIGDVQKHRKSQYASASILSYEEYRAKVAGQQIHKLRAELQNVALIGEWKLFAENMFKLGDCVAVCWRCVVFNFTDAEHESLSLFQLRPLAYIEYILSSAYRYHLRA